MADPWRALGAMRYTGRDGPRLQFEAADGVDRVSLTMLEHDVLRLRYLPAGASTLPRTWSVVGRAGDVEREGRDREDLSVFACPEPTVEADDARVVLRGARLSVEVTLAPFALRVCLPDGTPVLSDHPELAYRVRTGGGRGVRHTLRRDRAERFYGLGEASGPLDRHHRRVRLRPSDALGYDARDAGPLYKHLPIVLSLTPEGHAAGLLYDHGAEAVVDLGAEVDHYVGPYRYAEFAARELDCYLMVGPRLADVVRRVQDLTGYAPLAPRWTLGYLGSTMRYTDAEDPRAELAGFVADLERHGIGCSGFHLSSGYSLGDDGRRYVFEWNRRRVPEPAAMLEPLRSAGIRTLANVKPALLDTHPDYDTLATRGLFVRRSAADGDGPYRNRFWGGDGSYLDVSHEHAYAWWRARLRERILEVGVDASWNDNNEFQIDDDEARCAAGAAGDLRPTLTLLMNHASRAAQRDVRPDARDYQVTRSGGLGMQRYAQTWSGDNHTDWRTLAYNLPMGLSLSLCGWANHGHDVGGFAGPMPDAELLVRWIEQGVTMPRFTIHSWNDDGSATEPWSHPTVLPQVRRLLRLRTALVPYLATLLHGACRDGTPIARPLVYAFQGWRPGWAESFVHMLGPALLVAPVLEQGATTRRALLPPGAWLELGTGRVWPGEAWAELEAPLGRPVLLLRAGHALPFADEGDAGTPRPAWLAGGEGVAPPPIVWLAFPDESGAVRGELLWDDGVSRAYARGAVDRYALEGARTEDGLAAVLRIVARSGCPASPQRLLVPGGTEVVPWFGSQWESVPLRVAPT